MLTAFATFRNGRHQWPVGSATLVVAAMLTPLLLAGCGGDKKGKPASQTAVRVNKNEITVHQINFQLQQQRGLKPEQAEAAGKQILEGLIDQELALQKADDLKIDRDPAVMQRIDAARREIVARAYYEKVGEAAAKPTADEIGKYYAGKPALFSERRIYSLQEIVIESKPEQVAALRSKLAEVKNVNEFVEYLKASGLRFNGSQAVRSAEQLPLASLDAFARMKDGQSILSQTQTGVNVLFLAGSRSQPVTVEQATPAIEQYLLNERKREILKTTMKDLRTAAKIEYLGRYAGAAASAPSGAPAKAASPATPATPATPASGLDESAISKGLGLKK